MLRVLESSNKAVKDCWRSFDILMGINNTNAAWEEVSGNCLNGVWGKLLPEFVFFAGFQPVENVIDDKRRLGQEVGLDEVTDEDVTELLKSHGQPLSNEDLEELAAQLDQKEEEGREEEELPLREMKTSDLQRILSDIDKLTHELCEMDHDWERSATAKRSVMVSMSPYHEISMERKKKSRQTTLHAFSKKRDDPQPGTSSGN